MSEDEGFKHVMNFISTKGLDESYKLTDLITLS
jgi:hypothetical protein